jgi:hypothetical protein
MSKARMATFAADSEDSTSMAAKSNSTSTRVRTPVAHTNCMLHGCLSTLLHGTGGFYTGIKVIILAGATVKVLPGQAFVPAVQLWRHFTWCPAAAAHACNSSRACITTSSGHTCDTCTVQ